jgi:hypothetical protein
MTALQVVTFMDTQMTRCPLQLMGTSMRKVLLLMPSNQNRSTELCFPHYTTAQVTTVRIPKHSFNRRLLSSGAQALENQAPETCPKSVAYWLLGMSGLVATMVTIGGVTRLTRSGLSMTDWRLQGSLPPMNLAEWQKEFDR